MIHIPKGTKDVLPSRSHLWQFIERTARETAAQLVEWGVRGIWNFTNIDLHLELSQIPVENVHFSESLMVLSYRL